MQEQGQLPFEVSGHASVRPVVALNLLREHATYLLRVRGDAMQSAGIHDGDLIAVRKSVRAGEGKLVVARVEDAAAPTPRWRGRQSDPAWSERTASLPFILAPDNLVINGRFVGVVRERRTLH